MVVELPLKLAALVSMARARAMLTSVEVLVHTAVLTQITVVLMSITMVPMVVVVLVMALLSKRRVLQLQWSVMRLR
jgi:hypothetical protein